MSCNSFCKESDKESNKENNKPEINMIKYDYNNTNEDGLLPKLQVILDLDSTVINSLDLQDEINYAPKEFQEKFDSVVMKGYYRIFERPFLQDFLDYIFREFDVSVLTAADKDYAVFIVENIILKKPGRKLKYLFYSYHVGLSENYFNSPKDLRILWQVFKIGNFFPCNSVIIDDLPAVYNNNKYNAIPAEKFDLLTNRKTPNDKMINDNFLLKVINILEQKRKAFENSPCFIHLYNQGQNNLPCQRLNC